MSYDSSAVAMICAKGLNGISLLLLASEYYLWPLARSGRIFFAIFKSVVERIVKSIIGKCYSKI